PPSYESDNVRFHSFARGSVTLLSVQPQGSCSHLNSEAAIPKSSVYLQARISRNQRAFHAGTVAAGLTAQPIVGLSYAIVSSIRLEDT
ncbi:MAG: hypothetical protein OXU68_12300, partial [Bacteroidota bacterium]|nr:hypothetical protein [Bacteroidota bacterium]MDE2957770.1 hypothetical protein [Bacteroidota bacterium]